MPEQDETWRAHEERHTRTERALAESTLRLENQVAAVAKQLAEQVERTRVALSAQADVHAVNHDREHAAHERIHQVEKEARREKEAGMDRRLEGMNEFRDQLREQAGQFARIDSVQEMTTRIEEKIEGFARAQALRTESLEKQFIEYRDAHATFASEQIAALTKQIGEVRSMVNSVKDQEAGSRITTGKLFAGLGAVAAFLGIVVVIVNLITQ